MLMNELLYIQVSEGFMNDPNILQHTNFTPNLTAEQRDAWTKMWAEVKAAP